MLNSGLNSGSHFWLSSRPKVSRGRVCFVLLCLLCAGLIPWPGSRQKAATVSRSNQECFANEGNDLELLRAFEPRDFLETFANSRWTSPMFATITVTTTNDTVAVDSQCSLREAILAANSNTAVDSCTAGTAGLDTIQFSLGAGTPTINITSPLPTITEPVTINGNTGGATRVELNGSVAGAGTNGLNITAGSSTISNLVINRFSGNGINLQTNGGNTVQACLIGTDSAGNVDLGNGLNGISLTGTPNNSIGGAAFGTRNIISGNGTNGIFISGGMATGNHVEGNFIGTNAAGTAAIGNTGDGILVQNAPDNVIGVPDGQNILSGNGLDGIRVMGSSSNTQITDNTIGLNAMATLAIPNGNHGIEINSAANCVIGSQLHLNVISGNSGNGLLITNGASGTLVTSNIIGTDDSGAIDLGNTLDGIRIDGAANNTIGGVVPEQLNLISGNNVNGIHVVNAGTTGNKVLGNLIGTNAAGAAALANSQNGVLIEDASNNTIGGTLAGAGNVISGNSVVNVTISGISASGNLVQGNLIGLDKGGVVALGSTTDGINIDTAPNNTIGGTDNGARNVISGHSRFGVNIFETTFRKGNTREIPSNSRSLIAMATGNIVQGNVIGLNAAGTAVVANGTIGGGGIGIDGATNTLIGGTAAGAGNVISGNRTGIDIFSGTGTQIQGNFIGTNLTGTAGFGNTFEGVNVRASSNNTIGGTTAAARNIISSNGQAGINITSLGTGGNTIQGNYIGLEVTGTSSLSNGSGGVIIGSPNNLLGGTTNGAGNVISGNVTGGVSVSGSAATGNQIQGNLIGTDASGNAAAMNSGQGVLISGAPNNTIGGTVPGARNIISGNSQNGVGITGAAASGNVVQGNFIGLNAAGTARIANQTGIFISDAPNNLIGGTTTGAGNVISGNENFGIGIANPAATGNQIRGNLIGTNPAGTVAIANKNSGVDIFSANNNVIGGAAAGARNIISGNGTDQSGGITLGNGASGNQVLGNFIGTDITGLAGLGNGLFGMRISNSSTNNIIGGTTAAARNVISGNGFPGVRIQDATTTGNQVLGNYIGTNAAGTAALGNSGRGVSIEDSPNNTIGGATAGAGNLVSGNGDDGIAVEGTAANGNVVQGNFVGVNAAGTVALPNVDNGIAILSANNCVVGGTAAGAGNLVSGNGDDGIEFSGLGGGNNNVAQGNRVGVNATNTGAIGNAVDGVHIFDDASGNAVGGALAGAGNIIANNGNNGITIDSPNALNNAIFGNAIFGNAQLGIDLSGDGLTPNDAGDPDAGPNKLQNFPVLNAVLSTGAITGSLDSLPANSAYPVRVEFFGNTACDGTNGEGEVFLGFTTVSAPGSFTATVTMVAGKNVVTATATDNNGNTSEFSACKLANAAPTIAAAAPLTRQQGSAAINSQIATVSDADQASNTLNVTATPATGAGINISNILVSNAGQVTADVVASCTATTSTFTLKVTDSAGEMATATLTVNVIANTPPVLNYVTPQNVLASQALTINPASGPSDNGTVTNIIVQSAGTYTGTISVSLAGVVSLSNAKPAGSHLISIQATDNCGLNTVSTFTLNVTCQTITVTNPGINTGTVGATFNQTFTQAGGIGATTFSTMSTLPTGITLSSGGVLSGTPTQSGTFPITVKATDSNGCMGSGATYTLTINCPIITVNPASMPNGTTGVAYSQTTSATPAGTYTFTVSAGSLPVGLSLNSSTGLLNGTPTQANTFNFTIRATDANGCQGTRSYTVVIACPAITVNPASLPNATNGVGYSQTITATGGTAPYSFGVTGGTLPTGITLASGGALSGPPSQSGTFNFTITGTDANGCTGSRAYTLMVGCPAFPVTINAPSSATAGQNFSYDVTVTSACPDVPLNTTLTTATPTNTTFQSITTPGGWSCATPAVNGTGAITCTNASFAPRPGNQNSPNRTQAVVTFTIVLRVNPGAPIGSVITNNINVTGTAPGVPTVTATASSNTTVANGQADVVLTKSGEVTVVSGTTMNYTFNLTNIGPVAADNITFSDPLPSGTVFVSNTTPQGFTCTTPTVNAPGTVACTAASLASGSGVSFTITARVNANVACDTNIINTATASSSIPDPNTTNNTSSVPTLAQTQSDLAVNVTAPATAVPDTSALYTISVTNAGPSASFNTTLNNALPAAFSAETITASTGTCTGIGTNSVNCNLGTLAVGATATVTIQAHVPETCQTTTAVNTATVISGNCLTDPVAANNSQARTTTVLLGNVGAGACLPATSAISADKPGSILFTGLAVSGATAGGGGDSNQNNTRMNLTNVHPTLNVVVHLFFIDGATCSVADSFLCLTANQTTSFLMSDLDPGTMGYMMMIAVDGPPGFAGGHNTGCPISFNYLIGNANIKFTGSPRRDADLASESVAAGFGSPVPTCNPNSSLAELHFDGSPTGYNQLPQVLALDNIGSRADGNDTILMLGRVDGNWATGLQPIGPVFGLLYNDAEIGISFSFNAGTCLYRSPISNNFPRTTPRFEQFIPAGRSGWLKLWAANDAALVGAAFNRNDNAKTAANAFEGGHNLHILRLLPSAVITVPVFPPSC